VGFAPTSRGRPGIDVIDASTFVAVVAVVAVVNVGEYIPVDRHRVASGVSFYVT